MRGSRARQGDGADGLIRRGSDDERDDGREKRERETTGVLRRRRDRAWTRHRFLAHLLSRSQVRGERVVADVLRDVLVREARRVAAVRAFHRVRVERAEDPALALLELPQRLPALAHDVRLEALAAGVVRIRAQDAVAHGAVDEANRARLRGGRGGTGGLEIIFESARGAHKRVERVASRRVGRDARAGSRESHLLLRRRHRDETNAPRRCPSPRAAGALDGAVNIASADSDDATC